ncbi:hypothetical protein BP5796_01600 [Coleophoma crateriformis]|uniref:Tat pathway signal sequence n=1 Tax=Coleophoma crateriformis TaxID=565419 RepID=A0A3D8T0X8_9HELO|nr:hypothetical protein BP5796_01600 [Coleophoma crateriformis]
MGSIFNSYRYESVDSSISSKEGLEYMPSTSGIHLTKRQLIASIISVVALTSLTSISGFAIWQARVGDHDDFAHNAVFGHTPAYHSVFENDVRFVNSDPHDGKWDSGPSIETSTPWDELYAGAWIEIAHPAKYGLSGGLPVSQFYNNSLSPESQAFVPSMFHQIHCVGELKHAFTEVEQGKPISSPEHVTHCIEYLRQVVLCFGDLTLERPEFVKEHSYKGTSGWGAAHQCRDWTNVRSFPRPDFSDAARQAAHSHTHSHPHPDSG